jgi:hypothetical protein
MTAAMQGAALRVETNTDLLESFAAALREAGESGANVEAHLRGVARFCDFLDARSGEDATHDDVAAFVEHVKGRGISEKSVGAYRKILSRWLDHVASLRMATTHVIDGFQPIPDEELARPAPQSYFEPIDSPRSLVDEEFVTPPPVDGAQPLAASASLPEATPLGEEVVYPGLEHAAEIVSDFDAPGLGSEPGAEPVEVANNAPAMDFGMPAIEAWSQPAPEGWSAPNGGASPAADETGAPPAMKIVRTAPLPPAPAVNPLGEFAFAAPPSMAIGAVATIPLAAPGDLEVVALGDDSTLAREARAADAALPLARTDTDPRARDAGTSSPKRAPAQPPAALVGWGLRRGGITREGLDLTSIRDMARSGEIAEVDYIRRPGADWMRAGEYAPLRAFFSRSAGPVAAAATSAPSARGAPVLAWLGAVGGAFLAGLLWWATALAIGSEVPPLAMVGGLLSAGLSRLPRAQVSGSVMAMAALSSPLTLLWGKYLVFQTLQSGVAVKGFEDATSFAVLLTGDLSAVTIGSLAMGGLVGALLSRFPARH